MGDGEDAERADTGEARRPGADVPVGDHDESQHPKPDDGSNASADTSGEREPDDDANEASADDVTPAVRRVEPTPAVRRVAPTPAVERVEDAEPTLAEPERPLEDEATVESDEAFPDMPEDSMGGATPVERKNETVGGVEGPETDEELPLADHVEEMIKRLAIVVGVAGLVSIAVWPLGEEVINHLWYAVIPATPPAPTGTAGRGAPHLYQPLELLITQFKVASLAGLIAALPVFVYQTYAFMRPGLYPNERRYYLAAVPMSLVLAVLGLTFAYFVVLPAVFGYFYNYSQPVADIAFALSDTFNLILILMGYLAVVFQIPLFIMLAIMMGITTRRWLESRRLLFWGAFLGISFLFTPDPTGVAPILVAVTMVVLFEGTLGALRWTGN
ncbi:twin-arginine translocase subunit TatC [Salarchaeum japonicum]|uniref:Sec-independent protein translocase protein TatC n=1 Tax=Salarchaeum japonicum TaxID=555573 RepID=A0AAV3T0S0_9EURY|nr:twin-arginine translocase subunit TatC [Salarchaeum japonicum]